MAAVANGHQIMLCLIRLIQSKICKKRKLSQLRSLFVNIYIWHLWSIHSFWSDVVNSQHHVALALIFQLPTGKLLCYTSFCRQRGCSACNAWGSRDRSQREGWQRAKHSWGGQRGWKPAAWKAFAGKVRHVTWVKNSVNANISYLCCCGEGTGQSFGG